MWLANLSIRQPVFITMVLAAVVIVGGISYSRMGVDQFPNVSFPIVVVNTVLPGASPGEVETLVTKPLEDALASVNNLRSLRSVSSDGVSSIFLELELGHPLDEGVNAVRDQLGSVRGRLPEDARDPIVLRFDPTLQPILFLAVSDTREGASSLELRRFVEDVIKPRMEKLEDVAQVAVLGGQQRQVNVELSLDALRARSLSVQEVAGALRSQNISLPGGRLTEGTQDLFLKTTGEFRAVEDLERVVVAARGGSSVLLRDVATIKDGIKEERQYQRVNGADALILTIQKQSGSNTVRIADHVKAELTRIRGDFPNLSFTSIYDESDSVRESNQDVTLALIMGGVFAALIVFLFFRDLRNTLVTVAGLPVIVLGTFGVIHWLGFSINMMTLMALSLTVGILIDDAIVVRENIFRHMETGEEPKVAASRGSGEIAFAVLATTLTIVAVFGPVAFTGGIIGQFFRQFGITVAVAVLISLVEAFTLAPMLSAFFFRRIDPEASRGERGRWLAGLYNAFAERYRDLLEWGLSHRNWVAGITVAVFLASIGLAPFLGSQFMPSDDTGQFGIGLELPPGTPLEETDFAVRHLETLLLEQPEVDHVYSSVGSPLGGGTSGAVSGAERAGVLVILKTKGSTEAFTDRLRAMLEGMPGLAFSSQSFQGGASTAITSRRVLLRVAGTTDTEELDRISGGLVERMQRIPGLVDVDRSFKPGKPELRLVVDRDRASDLGVSPASAAATVRTLINGDTVSKLREGDRETDINLRLREADRSRPSNILTLTVPSAKTGQTPLSAVTRFENTVGPTQIDREGRQRRILVGANLRERAESEVMADIRTAIQDMGLPPGVTIEFTGFSEMNEESFQALSLSLALSVVFVYMVLASQFGSFIYPITIMLSLPLAAGGALLPLLLTRRPLDVMAMIGIIMLMGLVTKNAILLVDFILRARRDGVPRTQAVLQAGPVRLRPILMTTLSMIAGMLPTALALGSGSAWRAPMAITVIGGLVTSTLLTLVAVPVFYTLLDDLQASIRRLRRSPERDLLAELAGSSLGPEKVGKR